MAKQKNLNDRIKDLMKEGPLVALYFVAGISVLNEQIEKMDDKEVAEMFSSFFHPDTVRANVKYLHEELNK